MDHGRRKETQISRMAIKQRVENARGIYPVAVDGGMAKGCIMWLPEGFVRPSGGFMTG